MRICHSQRITKTLSDGSFANRIMCAIIAYLAYICTFHYNKYKIERKGRPNG
ncbi:hypothetical protein GQ54DRAFT_299653 [Martensiomyces pterosporus]|nr:hypothetical protein GQ54DRAFT_299653 [Martensiomyces pterosporus]